MSLPLWTGARGRREPGTDNFYIADINFYNSEQQEAVRRSLPKQGAPQGTSADGSGRYRATIGISGLGFRIAE
ncbi:hypothetical protein GCM10027294_01470 [Marinactinospora endophytica]